MKQNKLLALTFIIAGFSLFSCNQGEDKKATVTAVKADTPVTRPGEIMFIKHKVADFKKWLTAYESHDSVRQSYGLHSYGISRGMDDSNMVMVALRLDDINKAKAFVALPDLKPTMQLAGVVGEPTIMYYDRQVLNMGTNADSARVMITHKVKDWEAWKTVFDNHKQARVDAGIMDRSFGFEVGNNKLVTIVAVVKDVKKAKDFFASKDLQERMMAAGVEGPPDVFFYTLVKKFY